MRRRRGRRKERQRRRRRGDEEGGRKGEVGMNEAEKWEMGEGKEREEKKRK